MFVVSINKVVQAHITLAPLTCFVWARGARLQEEPGRYPIGLFTTKGTILSSLVSIYIILELNFYSKLAVKYINDCCQKQNAQLTFNHRQTTIIIIRITNCNGFKMVG